MTADRLAATRTRDAVRDEAIQVRTLKADVAARDAVLSAMSEGVLLFSEEGQLAYANQAALTILGRRFLTTSEVFPEPLQDVISEVRANVSQPRAAAATREFELGAATVDATATPAKPDGTIVVVLRDVTRAKSIERIRRDFVANASHALKTPVASILALAGATQSAIGDDPDTVARFIARLEFEAERLGELVSDLLALSRLEERGSQEWTRVRFDLAIQTGVERVRPRAEAAGLQLQADIAGALPVSGSEADLAHVAHNLLDNAVRYTREGGKIIVTARRVDGFAELSVADTGIGIPARDIDRIFERFYRVEATWSSQTGGTGLGLAIVRHVAETHGGSVHVRSVPGAGSTFSVRIPLATR